MLKDQSVAVGKTPVIERISCPSYKDFYQNYFMKSKPVIITGVADKWDALSRWNSAYLSTSSEDPKVGVAISKQQATIGNPEKGWLTHRKLEMGFQEFLSTIEDNSRLRRYYYLQYQKFEKFPHLLEDFKVPEFISAGKINARFWIGSGKNITPLHYDTQSNILAQVKGRKKFTLFAPSESRSLYPFPFHSKNRTLSPVSLKEPNYDLYPRFRNAHPIEVILEPGEMIFQPVFWWHQVETMSTEMTISITFMWQAPLRSYFTYLGLRNVMSSIFIKSEAN